MKIAGGIYREDCCVPHWSRLFGSGARAAAAIGSLSPRTELHAYACESWIEDVRASMGTFQVAAHLTEIGADIGFSYFHPLSVPDLNGFPLEQAPPLHVQGEAILRFGFIEGDAVVKGNRVVHDPQNWRDALAFTINGSRADALGVVLNETELRQGTGLSGGAALKKLIAETGARVVVIKRGPHGAVVYEDGADHVVPAFRSETVFKIGSGDIFSAHFAHHWAGEKKPAVEAALAASKAVASYVTTRDTQPAPHPWSLEPAPLNQPGRIYIAAPFFSMAQRWLVEEARHALLRVGAPVFSPIHDVGTGGSAEAIAQADLEGLRNCRAVLALIDGEDAGTLFELGYARQREIPVVALSEAPRPESLLMLSGSGCLIVNDFASAIYHAVWAASQ